MWHERLMYKSKQIYIMYKSKQNGIKNKPWKTVFFFVGSLKFIPTPKHTNKALIKEELEIHGKKTYVNVALL